MKSWTCLLLMSVCTFTNANIIYIWSDGDMVQAEVLVDGTACNTDTNTIISQDKAKHGQLCPKHDGTQIGNNKDLISSEDDGKTYVVTKSFNQPNKTTLSSESELDQAIDGLVGIPKEPELPTYQAPVYQGWMYDYIEDEFSNYSVNMATIISTDKNAGLLVVADNKKGLYVFFRLSQNVDNNFLAHYPLCYGECTIDLKVDDNKYPNIAIIRQGNMLYSKYPQTTLKRIKNGSVIKIRVPLLSGSSHTYTFLANEPLNIGRLKF